MKWSTKIGVALAGPAVNVIIAVTLFVVVQITGTFVPLSALGVTSGSFLEGHTEGVTGWSIGEREADSDSSLDRSAADARSLTTSWNGASRRCSTASPIGLPT